MSSHNHGPLVILTVVLLASTDKFVSSCPSHCACAYTACPEEFASSCQVGNQSWMEVHCDYIDADIVKDLPLDTKALSVDEVISSVRTLFSVLQELRTLHNFASRLANVNLESTDVEFFSEVVYLNFSGGHLELFPNIVLRLPKLRSLDLSENSLSGQLDLNLTSPTLETLDLSHNRISGLSVQGVLPNIHALLAHGNILDKVPEIDLRLGIKSLVLSKNLISFGNGQNKSLVRDAASCQVLPSSLDTLILRDNLLRKVVDGSCHLLTGVHNIEELDLGYNLLHTFPSHEDFGVNTTSVLKSLRLDGNSIYSIGHDALNHFQRLQFLSLSNNHIKRVPLEVFHAFYRTALRSNASTKTTITLERNPISCDCWEKPLVKFLHALGNTTKRPRSDITCRYPAIYSGRRLIDLNEDDLECTDIILRQSRNATCKEHYDCKLACLFGGLPHPQVHWISPEGKLISVESLAENSMMRSTYSLSPDGQQLSITSLEMQLTGIYKCIANNSLDSSESFAQLGLLPDPLGSIVAIAVSAASFAVAIAVNCVNMCKCYCENLDASKEDKEDQVLEEMKMESPLKSKLKGLHESEASLNANKYYRKYDYACQHIFLDAVIRGAHSVKQTLYDAKNSEFSNNVWEYASHLRDRLHIELPSSVQFPRVSMPSISLPSISMPTISMPSMPNLQSINTNIERLGTSVISRSQNLATSVGSVFTLRWLRYGNSDNDSDSDVESSAVSQVHAHIHKHHEEKEESSAECSPTLFSQTSSRKLIPSSVWSRKLTTAKCTTSRDNYATTSRSKSVRFGDVETFRIARSSSCSEIPIAMPLGSGGDGDSVEPACDIQVDTVPELHQFETSV